MTMEAQTTKDLVNANAAGLTIEAPMEMYRERAKAIVGLGV
jgi:hypothetical protein